MNFDEYNELNWCDLTQAQKSEYIKLYFNKYTSQNTLRLSKEEITRIKLNSINGYKSDYTAEQISHNYINSICPTCNQQFKLTHSQIMGLRKDINKLLCCSKKCASSYTTSKWHKNKTKEEWLEIRLNISDTLKEREKLLTDDEKSIRTKKLNSYWKNLDKTQRSEKAVKAASQNQIKGISKTEYAVFKLLCENKYECTQQHYECGLSFDFLVYKGNIPNLIELNGFYWHNYRPFISCEEDIKEYNELIAKGIQYRQIAKKWRYIDVEKVNYCKENSKNYIVIYYDKTSPEKIYDNIISNLNKGYRNLQLA
jgi:hypothetical protein